MVLTRREKLIRSVKVKLDELSSFDKDNMETKGYIDPATDDADFGLVNPISSYIDDSLDKASFFCLNDLPISVLSEDIENDSVRVAIDSKGVGRVSDIDEHLRLVRVHVEEWNKDVMAFFSTANTLYTLQQNKYTRGGANKPVVVYAPENHELELYSFQDTNSSTNADLYYIESAKKAEQVESDIADFIALRCAAYVLEILGDTDKAGVAVTEYENKKNLLLQ